MARGRNSKSCVLKDNARERKAQEDDASALDAAASVIRRRFTSENAVTDQLDFLAGAIRAGTADHTDQLAR